MMAVRRAAPRSETRSLVSLVLFLVALAAALALATPPPALAAEHVTLTGEVVEIWNLAGETRVEPGPGRAVAVTIERGGRDAAVLRLAQGAILGHETLRVLYGDADRVVYPGMGPFTNSQVRVRDDGTWNGRWPGGRRVTVAGGGDGLEAHADLVVEVPRGQRLSVHTVAGRTSLENVNGELVFDGGCSPVAVEGGGGRLSVDVGSGSVDVHGFDGDLSVDTGSGATRLDHVRGARCHVDAGSGSISGAAIAVDLLDLDTGSGRVTLDAVEARRVSVDTGSGGVDLALLSRSPEVMVDTGSGHARIALPGACDVALDLDSSSGGVRCEFPMSDIVRDEGTLHARIGGGAGRVHVDTGSGGIAIVRGR